MSTSPAIETSNIVTAMNLVSAGTGVTFVPEAELKIEECNKDLIFFEIDSPLLQWEIGIANKTGTNMSKQALLFIESIKNVYNYANK